MKNPDLYTSAHLIVAAIRIYEHKNTAPPSVDDVCKLISFSLEQGHLICNKLNDSGVIDIIEGAYGPRVCIKDHLKIENIPKGSKESSIKNDLKKFQDSQKKFSKKIEDMQVKHKKKQQDLFAELDQKLKDKLNK